MDFSQVISNRHSVREYDSSVVISQEEIKEMIQEASLAPSSCNLQPWRCLVFKDKQAKKDLKKIAYNQDCIETSSAVIAILGDIDMYKNAEAIYKSTYEAGYIDEEMMKTNVEKYTELFSKASIESRAQSVSFDAGLFSMQLMLVAKSRGYDTVTIGGFDKIKFIDTFDIDDRYLPIVLIALGKAASPAFKTTRLPVDKITSFI